MSRFFLLNNRIPNRIFSLKVKKISANDKKHALSQHSIEELLCNRLLWNLLLLFHNVEAYIILLSFLIIISKEFIKKIRKNDSYSFYDNS